MTTRRRFIQVAATLPPLLALKPALALTPDPSRQAMVVGNSDYRVAPLENPANDARTMSGMLAQAGFTVTMQLNANRTDMMAALDRFAAQVAKSDTRVALFYYAGHGAQLDWRNYLLPTDALVRNATEMRQSCIDLNSIIGKFSGTADKTIIMVLDACRNNPFGSNYQPEQKGLSQFDAPAGSLLAYATAPGNVASDGQGKNGLYTEHLVRELSIPGTKIEDALKRVRVNVRLASRGQQTPWEVTSLEKDIFMFDAPEKKISEQSVREQLDADINAWNEVKNSGNAKDIAGYLHSFPNGAFADAAQARLDKLIDVADSKNAQAPQGAKGLALPVDGSALIVAGPDTPLPQIITKSANPYSAGRYPLARLYSVGDEATYQHRDFFTGVPLERLVRRVSHVNTRDQLVQIQDSDSTREFVNLMGNTLNPAGVPQQIVVAELNVGRSWSSLWERTRRNGRVQTHDMKFKIASFEKVRTPVGEVEAFRIDGTGYRYEGGYDDRRLELRYWVVPGLNFFVKVDYLVYTLNGKSTFAETRELIAVRQRTMDLTAIKDTGSTRSFVVAQ